jgi:hypothetical protein
MLWPRYITHGMPCEQIICYQYDYACNCEWSTNHVFWSRSWNFQASAMFCILMGVTWLPILFTHIDKTSGHYIFAITNSFSGLWLFLLHCYWDKTLRESVGRKFSSHSNQSLSKCVQVNLCVLFLAQLCSRRFEFEKCFFFLVFFLSPFAANLVRFEPIFTLFVAHSDYWLVWCRSARFVCPRLCVVLKARLVTKENECSSCDWLLCALRFSLSKARTATSSKAGTGWILTAAPSIGSYVWLKKFSKGFQTRKFEQENVNAQC